MKSVGKQVVHHVISKLHNSTRLMSDVHINVRNNIYNEVRNDIDNQVRRQITFQLKLNI